MWLEHSVKVEEMGSAQKMDEICQKITVFQKGSHWPNLGNLSIKIGHDSSRLSKIII